MTSDLKRIIDQISKDKGIDRALLIEALEEAVMSAAKKKFGMRREMEAQFNEQLGEIELFQFREVVEESLDEQTEIGLKEAKLLDPDVTLGDELGSKIEDVSALGRIAAQSAKQVIIQKMKDAERDAIFEMFKDRKGDVVNGIVQRFERGNIIINLGRTDAILPKKGQMPRRTYRQGDRIRALLVDVKQTARDSQLILSRTDSQFVSKLFAIEVPEIAEGIVTVLDVVREPGLRSKIAVVSKDSDVDPVGACVGMKGSRVQNVVQELQGERIDIVPWSPDPAKFVSNALAPAEISMVVVDEEKNTLMVVVADDQLSLAIGRGGQNVRLASALLKWKIDVKSEQVYAKIMEEGYQSLLTVDGIDEKLADLLYDKGVSSVKDLATAEEEDIVELEIETVDSISAPLLIAAAQSVLAEQKKNDSELEAATTQEEDALPSEDCAEGLPGEEKPSANTDRDEDSSFVEGDNAEPEEETPLVEGVKSELEEESSN